MIRERPRILRDWADETAPAHSAWRPIFALACAALFQLAATGFLIFFRNPWPAVLALPVLGWIALYSFTKRFTALCHLFLGGALAASPIAAAIAVRGVEAFYTGQTVPLEGRTILLIAAFVLCWVAGFDVLYACQDLEFDRAAGLYSVPKRFGIAGALLIARAMHVAMIALLAWLAASFHLLWPAWVGVALVGALLAYEHSLVKPDDLRRLNAAFFTVNGYISLLFFVFWGAAVWVETW